MTLLGFLTPKTKVSTRFGPKDARDAIVADKTASKRITFWGKLIDTVDIGKSYRMTNILSRAFNLNGEIQLNTNSTTKVTPITSIPDVNEDMMADYQETTTEVEVEQTRVTQTFKCSACVRPITIINSTDPTCRCTNCQMKQKVSMLKKTTTAFINVNISSTNEKRKFVIFEEKLLAFLQLNGVPSLIHDTDRLEDYLLMQDKLLLRHIANSDIVNEVLTSKEGSNELLNV